MSKKIIAELAIGIILLTAISMGIIVIIKNAKQQQSAAQTTVAPQQVTASKDEKQQVANPASEFCVKNGGKVDLRTNADGSQDGYCVFENKKECEQWAFFMGDCKKDSDQVNNNNNAYEQSCKSKGGKYQEEQGGLVQKCVFDSGEVWEAQP